MTETPARLCYVLAEFSPDICSHLYHTWELLEDLTHRVKIYLFVERAAETPDLKFAEHVYVQKFTRFPFRLLERFLIFSLIRLRGYRNFYVHISHFSSLLAAVVARLSGGRAYYWNCGLRSVSANERRSFRSRMRQKFLNDCAFRLNLKMINYLVTGTPLMAEHYSRNYGISVNKIKVIPNSINLARFQPGNYDCTKIREEFGVTEGNKVVLFVHWLSEIECVRQLTYHIVLMKMAGKDTTREISMGKLLGGDLMSKVADGCLQMYGGMGFMNEMRISRAYRDSRLISIGGGASEVMSDILAKLEGY